MDNSNDLVFQMIDWSHYEEEDSEACNPVFKMRLFGKTKKNKNIHVDVVNFMPYFFVEIPSFLSGYKIDQLIDNVRKKVRPTKYNPIDYKESLVKYQVVKRHKFHRFSNDKLYKFVKLVFNSWEGMKAYSRVFNYPINYAYNKYKKFKLYESNIEPKFRFLHLRSLESCGWIKLKAGTYNYMKDPTCISDINVSIDWKNICPIENNECLPFIIASFDIECTSGDGSFPQATRASDKIIQIGTTFMKYGESESYYKHMITLGTCDDIDGVDVECYETETEVLLAWTRLIERIDPDILTGYNIFGFDYKYLNDRSEFLNCKNKFSRLCRLKKSQTQFTLKDLSSSALGENKLYYYDMTGRIQMDLMKVMQKDFKLASYKLDNVAAEFIRGNIKSINIENKKNKVLSTINTQSTYGLKNGQFISIYFNDGLSDNKFMDGKKFKIKKLLKDSITVIGNLDGEELKKYKAYWCQAKDDVSPQDIFRLQEGSSSDRAIIAKYCIQDCELVNKLIAKLQIITNNIGMANVCSVPMSYLFLRGQGVKIFSLVAKKCRLLKYLLPVLKKKYKPKDDDKKDKNKNKDDSDDEFDTKGYEGATVFPPDKGIHFEPVAVLDYSSLYPRSMIHRNVSQECLLEDPEDPELNNLPNYIYRNVTYRSKDPHDETKIIYKTCTYAQKKDGSLGIVPQILQDLLDARTNTKKAMAKEKDPFIKAILDGLQLAYKLTANSLYGQTGAETSPIYCKDVAASTTATGREMLTYAKEFNQSVFKQLVDYILDGKEKKFRKMINKLFDGDLHCFNTTDDFKELTNGAPDLLVKVKESRFIDKKLGHETREDFINYVIKETKDILGPYRIKPKVIYGDTDSVFINFKIYDPKTSEFLTDHNSLKMAIRLGILAGLVINKVMPFPHDLEYEKTFHPFCILTKKRYVGNLYEIDPEKYKQKSMGIVLKRRDNAPIVKIVFGGIIDKLLNEKSIDEAIKFTKRTLSSILNNEYPLDKFIITKTLKSTYKNRDSIAHAVLADRMARRDPGNKPQSNDRIPYAYIITKGKVKLQGDKIEHPDYIIKNKLHLDYLHYITNQIMKPCVQVLEILVKNAPDIFNRFVMIEENRRKGKKPISVYFQKETIDDDNLINFDELGMTDKTKTFKSIKINTKKPKLKKSKTKKTKKITINNNLDDIDFTIGY